MPDQKISQLTALADVADNDLLPIVDVSAGATRKVTAAGLATYISTLMGVGSFAWDSASSSPAAVPATPKAGGVTSIHRAMRRCVVSNAGAVVYYLSATDSTKKDDGTAADLSGAAGQVMVEIQKFYARREKVGTVTTWTISAWPLAGFSVHPAFIKDGVEVSARYIGAYDACVYDTSASAYVDGLNLDSGDTLYTYAEDVLASVAGKYPAVGITRAQARQLAGNRGAGWRLADFWLMQAIQLLYLVEHQSFYSQSILGAGNTNGSYLASSALQTDSPHTIAGASNSLGNGSTNTTSGAGVSAKPGTSYMSYRGIENLYGNCWNWIDGFNILDQQAWVSNTTAHFADGVSTNYTALDGPMPATSGYVTGHKDVDNAFLPAGVGGSSSTYWTDYYYTASGWRVAHFGGGADDGASAGAFSWGLAGAASRRYRNFGARLAR